MNQQSETSSRLRRAVDELVITEMFLVQATIESANAIGEGLGALGRQLTGGEQPGESPADSLRHTLQRVADEAIEPYSSRFTFLRDRLRND